MVSTAFIIHLRVILLHLSTTSSGAVWSVGINGILIPIVAVNNKWDEKFRIINSNMRTNKMVLYLDLIN